ncbi:helix-turn-helix domain-containing protein [Virgibacillus ainsalahensis]
MDQQRVGRRIKGFRKLKGYTQTEFADTLNVSVSVIGGAERGTRKLTDELLEKIAAALTIKKEDLTLAEVQENEREGGSTHV